MNKYHNREVTSVVGHFDSQKEYNRYRELDLLQRAGKIKNLKRQIRYSILPAQKRADGRRERGIEYIADFVYEEATPDGWQTVVEDVKGKITAAYVMKRKMMLWRYGISIRET